MMITNDGTIIRTPVSGIPFYNGRSAGGVIVMRLAEGSSLVNFARIEKDEELEAEAEAASGSSDKEVPSDSESDDFALDGGSADVITSIDDDDI